MNNIICDFIILLRAHIEENPGISYISSYSVNPSIFMQNRSDKKVLNIKNDNSLADLFFIIDSISSRIDNKKNRIGKT
ncbi:hypothetical protein [Acidiluteibacter ferrifornacis]|uniref:Uncharacterized protein n=1 Tax=Acidiluteibacter ferrifornacis TaxID=2692424 RepID=A0A6N9NIA4_9FLAO|nr:hypothetical protein [Acidiluteibacter ferrifornacis]NBG64937.1 hypothetical protein [Acidiluteibacter ferrifornacis]